MPNIVVQITRLESTLSGDCKLHVKIIRMSILLIRYLLLSVCGLGGPTVIQNLTDSSHNQNVVLPLLQNSKSKISEKSDQN